jgi:hypothetical protein
MAMKKFTENDLRFWEFCKTNGHPLPPIPHKKLIALWKKHGFDERVLPILRQEFRVWEMLGKQNIKRN